MNKLLIMMGMVVVTTAVATTALAAYVAEPDAAHAAPTRRHTGIPSVAVARNGRLWVTFYGSPTGGEDSNNYCTLSTSADGGRTWTDVLVADPDGLGPKRAFDPEIWTAPDGRLLWTWAERVAPLQAVDSDPGAGCNTDPKNDRLMCVELQGDALPKPPYPQPRQIARGVMMCKPIIRRDGAWLFPVAHWSDAPSACFYEGKGSPCAFHAACYSITQATPPLPTLKGSDSVRVLLRRKDLSVTDVSTLLHFCSTRHFATMFKKETGCTPTEWKRGGNLNACHESLNS